MSLCETRSVIDINDRYSFHRFSSMFKTHLHSTMDERYKSLVILCIGTDRSTGDSLGPIVGYKLSNLYYQNIAVYGTLDEPVHAKNLSTKVNEIHDRFVNPFIIAIDACLGRQENIGHINISDGPIYPGAGVNKKLLPVGHINVTGIVNVSGYMEYMVLQNTRLSIVMKMADVITRGIMCSMDEIEKRLAVQCI